MPDEIIEELWGIKDSIAGEHGNDVRKLAAYLQDGKRRGHSSRTACRRLFKAGEHLKSCFEDKQALSYSRL